MWYDCGAKMHSRKTFRRRTQERGNAQLQIKSVRSHFDISEVGRFRRAEGVVEGRINRVRIEDVGSPLSRPRLCFLQRSLIVSTQACLPIARRRRGCRGTDNRLTPPPRFRPFSMASVPYKRQKWYRMCRKPCESTTPLSQFVKCMSLINCRFHLRDCFSFGTPIREIRPSIIWFAIIRRDPAKIV